MVTGWLDGNTVGEPDAPFTQFRLDVYCVRLLTLPGAITSITVALTLEDNVATAAPKGPLPAPVDVAVDNVLPLLAARTL